MKKKTKILIGLIAVGSLIGVLAFMYIFSSPHRDVQASKVDYTLDAHVLVDEYLNNLNAANEKYLNEDGDSKILAVTGIISDIDQDLNGQFVVLLKTQDAKAGVSCTFTETSNSNAEALSAGIEITVKGVIRAGASYDADLEIYEDVILEKCDII